MDALCLRSGEITSNDPLVEFLYILLRDHLPAGVVEGVMAEHVTGSSSKYTNGWLAEYAIDLATRLKETR